VGEPLLWATNRGSGRIQDELDRRPVVRGAFSWRRAP
jgi:hypothetical protein